jgi:hypothetical protein
LEHGELFTQEEVLGCQRAARPRNEYEEMDQLAHCVDDNVVSFVSKVEAWSRGMNAQLYTLRDFT